MAVKTISKSSIRRELAEFVEEVGVLCSVCHKHLAQLAVEAMQAGYDEAIDATERGILRIVPGK